MTMYEKEERNYTHLYLKKPVQAKSNSEIKKIGCNRWLTETKSMFIGLWTRTSVMAYYN